MSNRMIALKNVERIDYAYNEAINTLRTNLQYCGSNIKKVMFTSAIPGEGKSSTALSTAWALAKIGKSVLFIDADIRKSVFLARHSQGMTVNGLTQYLSGQKMLEEVIYQVKGNENLSVIFAGPYSPNPSALLEEELFGKIFETQGPVFDYIIVDTPPMAGLIDGAIVARHCDGAIMVIESGGVSYRLEQKVKEQIEMTGCRILGAVLSQVDVKTQGYYGKYGNYGKYGRYGTYEAYAPHGQGAERSS